jgi:hypothetical protein
MARRALAVLSTTLALAGCFSKGAVHSYRTEPGRPVAAPGPDDAYLVWHDRAGWHLRARSETGRLFSGVVESRGARQVSPVGVPAGAVRPGGGAIAFSFAGDPRGAETGFDWQGGCADFALYVGEDARPLRVFAGAYGASPPRVPFSLCP